MQSDLPKVLHKLAGCPLVVHAMRAGRVLDPARVVVVVGHGGEQVARVVADEDPDATIVTQGRAAWHRACRGTGARGAGRAGRATWWCCMATPRSSAPKRWKRCKPRAPRMTWSCWAFMPPIRDATGGWSQDGDRLERIVEFKDATADERAITLCNSGVLCADRAVLFDLIDAVGNDNASGEYYLTDVVALARARGLSAGVVTCAEAETLGINTRAELAGAEAAFQVQARRGRDGKRRHPASPRHGDLRAGHHLGRDCVVEPYVVFGPGVTVESGATIRAFSHLEGCHVSRGAVVGPYARLRPGAELAEDVRVGNFVEIKNAVLGDGAKVNHLSYVGDADVGASANLGAGTVTCNYDGVFKHHTTIGEGAFIGSSTMLVAPVTVGAEALTGSGSVITRDVPAGDLALGRGDQVNKPGLGRKLMDRLRARKKSGQKD